MRAVKYIAALWIGVIVYAFSSLESGAMGFDAYRQLEAERDREQANLDALRLLNKDLESERDALLYDDETLMVYAREHGFAAPDERVVRVVGLGPPVRPTVSPGEVVTAAPPIHTPNEFLRIFSFCAALTVGVCMAAYDLLRYLKGGV